ncbi:hypothetical protein VTH06DRAFT_1558 [Thermothelomyces fergusii]
MANQTPAVVMDKFVLESPCLASSQLTESSRQVFAGNDSPSFVFPTAIATKGGAGGGSSGSGRPPPLCPRALLSGYTVDGTFQQYAVAKAAHVARIPAGCELDAVAPVLCAGITAYKGLRESGARPGEVVAVVGAGGGLGSMAIQYARAMGLRVVAVDAGAAKGESCRALGAEAYVDFAASADLVADVRRATPDGLGPHAVLLLAVAEEPFRRATEYVRSRGTIVCIGLPARAYLRAPVFDTVVRMITIKGSYVGNRQDTREALDFFRRGLIRVPYKVVGLSELQDVYRLMEEGKVVGRYVVDTSR